MARSMANKRSICECRWKKIKDAQQGTVKRVVGWLAGLCYCSCSYSGTEWVQNNEIPGCLVEYTTTYNNMATALHKAVG